MATASSITDSSLNWPSWDQLARVLTLQDYNTRVVVIGTTLLGVAAGLIGTFMLLRKRALMGDALSHATLPGIGLAFIAMTALGMDGKYLPGLLAGAVVFGVAGVGAILAIQRFTRLREDSALGIVLSVFFGLGVAILGVIQKYETGNAAGLESFIYGKTASMLSNEAIAISVSALVVALVCALLFKEFAMICFDQGFAASQGWPVLLLDLILMALVVIVTVIGLQAVGLILVIALLIIPPAAAQFWTHRLSLLLLIAGLLGGLSGLVGAGLSSLVPRLPAGAVIVLVASAFFVVSMFVGPARGVIMRLLDQWRLARMINRQNLLRAMYEAVETSEAAGLTATATWGELLDARSWTPRQLRQLIRASTRAGWIAPALDDQYQLTPTGLAQAQRVVRNHRLWEMYLIAYADVAPSQVDRGADDIEHVIGHEMAQKLESLIEAESGPGPVPPSPHPLSKPGDSPAAGAGDRPAGGQDSQDRNSAGDVEPPAPGG